MWARFQWPLEVLQSKTVYAPQSIFLVDCNGQVNACELFTLGAREDNVKKPGGIQLLRGDKRNCKVSLFTL